MATMLSLVQQVCDELGLPHPSAVASSTEDNLVQILALMNATGYELIHLYEWQAITKEYRFTTVYYTLTGTTTAGSAVVTGISSTTNLSTLFMATGTGINQDTYIQSVDSATQVTLTQAATASGSVSITFSQTKYAFPADFDRLIDRTDWDKSQHWENIGPATSQQWQWLKSGFIATGPRVRFRPLGGYYQIWPPLSSNDLLGFEYVSNQWALSSGGVAQSSFQADTDTGLFRDRLMVLGTKLKYFETKNFDTTALYRDFTRELDLAKSQDKSAPILSFAPRASEVLIGFDNIPDSGYGS